MNLIPGRNYTVAAGRQIVNACTHPHSKIFFVIFSDVFISFRTGYSFFCWLVCFFGVCMCASNSVAILLSLPSVNGKVCYDEISVLDKICCVIVFSFILVFKGIGCYFCFFYDPNALPIIRTILSFHALLSSLSGRIFFLSDHLRKAGLLLGCFCRFPSLSSCWGALLSRNLYPFRFKQPYSLSS